MNEKRGLPTPENLGPSDEVGTIPSIEHGEYRDPPAFVVESIHQRYTNPQRNIEAVLMKSFELAGLVKSVRQIRKLVTPLEHSGLMPSGRADEPEYKTPEDEQSEFIDRRDEQLLLEFLEGHDARNQLLLKVKEMTAARLMLSEEEVNEIRSYGMAYRRREEEAPPALKIIAVMTGLMPSQDPKASVPQTEVPSMTKEMATDVYWMMLRDELSQSSPEVKTQITHGAT